MLMKTEKTELAETALSREDLDDCTCIEYCDEDPKTACSLSGIPHVHPETPGWPGITGPCPVHPGRPGDH
ncbi:MAG: cysteine/serine-rich nuclear protein [Actinobacteria bacterium]|nr:cysteine/serine-rich nuclear protein [Actinomycetota bacterium]